MGADPHMHTHAYALNLTHDGKEQRWKAAQLGDIVGERPYYEAVFLSRLARYMRGLGYEIDPHGKYWDVAGLSRATVEKFSRRTAEIDEAAAELKIVDPAAHVHESGQRFHESGHRGGVMTDGHLRFACEPSRGTARRPDV